MSTDQSLHDRARIGPPTGAETNDGRHPGLTGLMRPITGPLSALAFWAAIALPALYIPLLVAGLESTGDLSVFLGLFGLHLLALFGGRSHRAR